MADFIAAGASKREEELAEEEALPEEELEDGEDEDFTEVFTEPPDDEAVDPPYEPEKKAKGKKKPKAGPRSSKRRSAEEIETVSLLTDEAEEDSSLKELKAAESEVSGACFANPTPRLISCLQSILLELGTPSEFNLSHDPDESLTSASLVDSLDSIHSLSEEGSSEQEGQE